VTASATRRASVCSNTGRTLVRKGDRQLPDAHYDRNGDDEGVASEAQAGTRLAITGIVNARIPSIGVRAAPGRLEATAAESASRGQSSF
jgi:hypothetical protein